MGHLRHNYMIEGELNRSFTILSHSIGKFFSP